MLNRAKPYLLRVHRWLTLVFALPLAILIVTGVILALEPMAISLTTKPGTITSERLVGLLQQYDPQAKANGIVLRTYENRLTINGAGVSGRADIILSTGAAVDDSGGLRLSDVFMASRRLHEHFLFDQRWVVTASTIAMVVLMLLGVLMGWPRLRNTISGWHQGVAWFGLPLAVLSPVTGLMIVAGLTFSPLPKTAPGPKVSIAQAVEILGKERDLSGLIWLRQRGPRLMARLNEGGAFKVYTISAKGIEPMGANLPRALHEGNFAGVWSGLMVLITALGLGGLMVTGLILYARRALRPRQRNRAVPVAS